MFTSLLVGLSFLTAAHGGPSINHHPLHKETGGFIPVGIAAPSVADPGETITVSVAVQSAPDHNLNLNVSTSNNGLFTSIPSQLVIPAGSYSGSIQATLSN